MDKNLLKAPPRLAIFLKPDQERKILLSEQRLHPVLHFLHWALFHNLLVKDSQQEMQGRKRCRERKDLTSRLGCQLQYRKSEVERRGSLWQTHCPAVESQILWQDPRSAQPLWFLCEQPAQPSPRCWRLTTLEEETHSRNDFKLEQAPGRPAFLKQIMSLKKKKKLTVNGGTWGFGL